MRDVIIVNMLDDYDPSPEAKRVGVNVPASRLQMMTPTMMMMPTDERSWCRIGKIALAAKCGACQQCVGIVFSEIVRLSQNGKWTSPVRLVHVKGHHFVVVGSNPQNMFIIDLWLQNLHRPGQGETWSVMVFLCTDQQAAWYMKQNWDIDLAWDPNN